MARIHFKEPTLNGQASIVGYDDREYLYLRIKREGKRYTHVSLGTTDVKTAHQRALDAYTKTITSPPRSRSRRFGLDTAVREFLEWKKKQADRGQIKQRSVQAYEQRVYQRIIPYTKVVGVTSISDIDKTSFDGYAGYYLDIKTKGKWKSSANGLAASTINSDLTTLQEFLDWMVDQDLLDPRKIKKLSKIKDRKNYRDDANPALFPEEFDQFKKALYLLEDGVKDSIQLYKRRWFIHWVLFMYHGGFRCHEARQIRLGNIDIQKRPDGKLKGIVQILESTKTGKRTVIMNGNTLRKVRSHLTKGWKLRAEQIDLHNHLVDSGKIKEFRWRSQERKELPVPITKDTFLLANPFSEKLIPYTDEHIRSQFNKVLLECDFDKRYTLHSLRSTHVTHSILKGVSIRVIADNVGNSQSEIESTYNRLNNLLNIDQLGFHQDASSDESEQGIHLDE
tara:strand:+ start:195 stop:1547 length:1353 start_codon:yes stop_codon:yes gene_type:complete